MTVIAAMVDGNTAWMAADRRILDGWVTHRTQSPKIIKKDGWLLGSTGPLRVKNALASHFDPPIPLHTPDEDWIQQFFLPEMMKGFSAAHNIVSEGWIGGKADDNQGTILCAYPGIVFAVQSDWAVDVWDSGFAAIGTGSRYVLSVFDFWTRFGIGLTGQSFIREAVQTACNLDIYCGDGIDVLESKEEKSNDHQED